MENIKKFIPVECGKCAHAKVCRFKADVDKGMRNVPDKNISEDSPFVLTMTCECKQDPIITPKSIVEKPKDNQENMKEIVTNAIQDALKERDIERLESSQKVNTGIADTRNIQYATMRPADTSTSGVTASMATTQPIDERTATINQLEELALMDLKSNANHNVEERVFKKKKKSDGADGKECL